MVLACLTRSCVLLRSLDGGKSGGGAYWPVGTDWSLGTAWRVGGGHNWRGGWQYGSTGGGEGEVTSWG